MPSTPHFQIFIDCESQDRITPDASASYVLVLSEKLEGFGAAKGSSVLQPVLTIEQQGELALPQTFSFMIDGATLKEGHAYQVSLRYQATTGNPHGKRLGWKETFVAQDQARIAPAAVSGHGPCKGRTNSCLSW